MHKIIFQCFVYANQIIFFLRDPRGVQTGVFKLFHFADIPHGVFGNDAQKCFRRGIFKGNGYIFFLTDFRNFILEPLNVLEIKNFWRLNNDNAAIQRFRHSYHFHHLALVAVWRCLYCNKRQSVLIQ